MKPARSRASIQLKKAASALSRLYWRRSLILYEFPLKDQYWFTDPDAYLIPISKKPGLEIRQILREEVDRFRKVLRPRRAREIPRRFEKGHLCWGGIKDGLLVGFQWVVTSPVYDPVTRLTFLPEKGDFLVYDQFVLPDHRGGAVHAAIAAEFLRQAATELGWETGYAFCLADAFRTFQALYRRAGTLDIRAIQRVTTVFVLGVVHHRFEAVDPSSGEKLGPSRKPREGQAQVPRRYFREGGV